MDELKRLIRSIPIIQSPASCSGTSRPAARCRRASRRRSSRLPNHTKDRADAGSRTEARGFILGGAVADRLGCGFIPLVRRVNCLEDHRQEYTLEYGVDAIEIHEAAIRQGERILIIDDLIATGGTAEAAAKLIRRSGGEVVGAAFVIDLPDLGGLSKLEASGVKCHALVAFEGH